MVVKITPNDKGNPVGKLADAELHFGDGALEGLKLIGFGIWERKGGNGRNVTFPARQYAVNGERRSFALLRPIVDTAAQERVRELVLIERRELRWHRASYGAEHRIFAPADPVLVSLRTLERWLWSRLQASAANEVHA